MCNTPTTQASSRNPLEPTCRPPSVCQSRNPSCHSASRPCTTDVPLKQTAADLPCAMGNPSMPNDNPSACQFIYIKAASLPCASRRTIQDKSCKPFPYASRNPSMTNLASLPQLSKGNTSNPASRTWDTASCKLGHPCQPIAPLPNTRRYRQSSLVES